MAIKQKEILGLLIIVVLFSGVIYISLENQVKIRVDFDKSTFYTKNENNRWTVVGREYNRLFKGTSSIYRDVGGITIDSSINEELNKTTIIRKTPYKREPIIVDTYIFDGTVNDLEQFPISHTVEIFNGVGFFYRYEVRDLIHDGTSGSLDTLSMDLGRNMQVTWQEGYRWARLYKSGKLKVQYDIPTYHEKFE